MIYAMPDFSSVPLGFKEKEYDTRERLALFEKENFGKLDDHTVKEFDNIYVTYRLTNGWCLSRDLQHAENFGFDENDTLSEEFTEDGSDFKTLAVFAHGGCQLKCNPALLEHLFIQLQRTTKSLYSDLYFAQVIDACGVYGYNGEEGELQKQFDDSYPSWFLPLSKAGIGRGKDQYDKLMRLANRDRDRSGTLVSIFQRNLPHVPLHPAVKFTDEREQITKAVDAVVKAEAPMWEGDPHDYFNPEMGLFYFNTDQIQHHEDLSEATHNAVVEGTQENETNDLISKVQDLEQLNHVHDYLRAIDNLITLCKQLP